MFWWKPRKAASKPRFIETEKALRYRGAFFCWPVRPTAHFQLSFQVAELCIAEKSTSFLSNYPFRGIFDVSLTNFFGDRMMVPVLKLCRAFSVLSLGFVAACTDYAYVGMPQGQPSREVKIPDGSTRLIPTSSSIVGLAYDDSRERIFLRNLPGTQLQELDRDGRVLRTFSAQRVPAGCGGATPSDIPIKECGLALRESDGHLFLDHPNGLMISELTQDGQFVRNIRITQPQGPNWRAGFRREHENLVRPVYPKSADCRAASDRRYKKGHKTDQPRRSVRPCRLSDLAWE